jgi:ABC-type dipeptide/oligopeptide/nickel transport system permease component
MTLPTPPAAAVSTAVFSTALPESAVYADCSRSPDIKLFSALFLLKLGILTGNGYSFDQQQIFSAVFIIFVFAAFQQRFHAVGGGFFIIIFLQAFLFVQRYLLAFAYFFESQNILLKLFQPGGQFPSPAEPGRFLWYLLFPAVAIALPRIAMTVRMLRSTIVYEMNSDYVRTAISRGNDRSAVLRVHVLKNSLVPVISFLAQTMAEIVAGGIVVEQVFSIPGLGRMLVSSISNRDYPVVQAIIVILALWVVLSGTLADLVNQRIDPRLRLGGDR